MIYKIFIEHFFTFSDGQFFFLGSGDFYGGGGFVCHRYLLFSFSNFSSGVFVVFSVLLGSVIFHLLSFSAFYSPLLFLLLFSFEILKRFF
jgi:hypothetical protein